MTTVTGSDMNTARFTVFSYGLQDAVETFTDRGGNVLISGANIGTDIEDGIFPYRHDREYVKKTTGFTRSVLGYRWTTNNASRTGRIDYKADSTFVQTEEKAGELYTEPNPVKYSVESPDGIAPAAKDGKVIMRYSDTGISAGICHQGEGYRTVCIGFPIEALKEDNDIDTIISNSLEYFNK